MTLLGLVVFGLIFRATLYWKLPVLPGEPAGIGDVIELLIYFAVLLFAALSMLFGILLLAIPSWRNAKLAAAILVAGLISPPAYYILHTFVP